jgi:hypothetical protein
MPANKDQLAKDLEAARSPQTTPDELDVLAESPYEAVRMAVVEHPATKPFELAGFVPLSIKSPYDLDIAAALARNNNTPEYALVRLAERVIAYLGREPNRGKCSEVCVALCSNPGTPFEAISELLAPSVSGLELRMAVARETERQDVLLLLQSDRSKAVRKQARHSSESISSA